MDKKDITIIIALIIIAIGVAFIITERVDFCETAKNDSYNAGFNLGVEQWNSAVIYGVNTNGAIPYWLNGSYMELPITQMCGGLE